MLEDERDERSHRDDNREAEQGIDREAASVQIQCFIHSFALSPMLFFPSCFLCCPTLGFNSFPCHPLLFSSVFLGRFLRCFSFFDLCPRFGTTSVSMFAKEPSVGIYVHFHSFLPSFIHSFSETFIHSSFTGIHAHT